MRYQGGKCQIARNIVDIILEYKTNEDTFVDLFVGGGAVAIKAAPHFDNIIVNDLNKYIIAMYRGIQNDRQFPTVITEHQYKYIRSHKDDDLGLTAFAGFCCSFGGKFFQGYARGGNKNYALAANNAILRDKASIKKFQLHNLDYREVDIPANSIIYLDPPYANTTIYNGVKPFYSDEFWDWVRQISKTNKVFVSEQSAPDDFISIWSKPKRRQLGNNNKSQPVIMEHLFVYEDGLVGL